MGLNLDEERNQPPHQSETLTKKVVKGSLWVLSLRFINRGLGFIRTIILARLLAPNDFGLLGIAMLAASTLDYFSQTGFQSAIIQKKDNVDSYLDTAWTVSALRGIFLFLILFFSAPLIAAFFNAPHSVLIIQIVALSMILTGFRNVGILFFHRELKFDKQFTYEISATLTDLIISISLALVLRDVWALIWGGLAGNLVRLIMSYILHPYKPRITINFLVLKELSLFGWWIFGSSILIFFIIQGSDIFVGKMLGVTALGLYQMAFLLANLSASEIAQVISQVTFPVYAKIQEDLPRLREAYLNVLQLTAFVSIPLAFGIFILSPEFTQIFLGSKWLGIVDAMQILSIAGLFSSITATTLPVFYGIGKPKIETTWQLIRLLTLCSLIYPLALHWNIVGVSIAVTLGIIIQSLGLSVVIIKATECKTMSFLKMIILPLLNSTVMVFILILLKNNIVSVGLTEFFLLIITGSLCYCLGVFLIDGFFDYGFKETLKKRVFDLII